MVVVICFSNTYVTFIMCLELFCLELAFTGTLTLQEIDKVTESDMNCTFLCNAILSVYLFYCLLVSQ